MTSGTRIGLKVTLAIVSLALLSAFHASACTFAWDYFYQITALKGRVVGTPEHHIFDPPRWLRQTFVRKHAKLTLYEYREPFEGRLLVRTVDTDEHGSFDFGPLGTGHYTLWIDDGNSFEVEIKDLPRKTKSVTIDVSPVNPDCKDEVMR